MKPDWNRDWNHEVDRVLHHLRQAEPPAGLEARVLQRLQQHPRAAPPSILHRTALVSFAAAAAAIAIILHLAPHPSVIQPTSAASHTNPVEVPAVQPIAVEHESIPRVLNHKRQAAAPAQAQLVSFPAPEPPPTEQEKLLAQVAATNDPAARDLLNPEISAHLIAQGNAEFERFIQPQPDSHY